MSCFLNILYCALLTIFLSCCTPHASAEQLIEFNFVNDAASGEEVLQAKSEFRQHGRSLQKVLLAISGYAELHSWITGVALIKGDHQQEVEFLIEFKFPWPVGCRWSHIRVQRDGTSTITWQQIDGNIEANEGRLAFTTHDNQGMTVEYFTTINLGLGLPDLLLRGFKKKFVAEFINAAYVQAENEEVSELALATPGSFTAQ